MKAAGTFARAAVVTLLAAGCASRAPVWEDQPRLTEDLVHSILGLGSGSAFDRDLDASEVPVVPIRQRVRPCCIFGHGLKAEIGPIPVPGVELQNVIAVEDLGPHRYDSGFVIVGSNDGKVFESENNGLVYTCRGGFIDTAHLRDYADWTMFVAPALGRTLETGATITLPDEGGTRSIVLKPVPETIVTSYGRRHLAVSMAEWIVFQMSIWHEIATWYGWSALPLFPERASAFSPEDLYSNALGIRLAAGVIAVRAATNDTSYEHTMDRWTRTALRDLGAVDGDGGDRAADLLDGLWWDSSKPVPDDDLVLRRNFDTTGALQPWTVERSGRGNSAGWEKICPPGQAPIPLQISSSLGDVRFADHVSLRIQPEASLAARLPSGSREITQADFEDVVRAVREAALVEFGPLADSPSDCPGMEDGAVQLAAGSASSLPTSRSVTCPPPH